jgi:hypothetical protein
MFCGSCLVRPWWGGKGVRGKAGDLEVGERYGGTGLYLVWFGRSACQACRHCLRPGSRSRIVALYEVQVSLKVARGWLALMNPFGPKSRALRPLAVSR